MAILSAISYLQELCPMNEVTGDRRNKIPPGTGGAQGGQIPPGGSSGSGGWERGSVTVVTVAFSNLTSTSSLSSMPVTNPSPPNSAYPWQKRISNIQDITGDGFFPWRMSCGQTVPATAAGGWDNTTGVANPQLTGSKFALFYKDDGCWHNPSGVAGVNATPHSNHAGGGIPDTSGDRTFKVTFDDGSTTDITVFVLGRNALHHKGTDITNMVIDSDHPSFFNNFNFVAGGQGGSNPGGGINNAPTAATLDSTNLQPSVGTQQHGYGVSNIRFKIPPLDANGQAVAPPGWPVNAPTAQTYFPNTFNTNELYVPKYNTSVGITHWSLLGNPWNWTEPCLATGTPRKAFAAKIVRDDDDRYAGIQNIPVVRVADLLYGARAGDERLYVGWMSRGGNWSAAVTTTISGQQSVPTQGEPINNYSGSLDNTHVDYTGVPLAHESYFGIPASPMSLNNSSGSLETEVREVFLKDVESWLVGENGGEDNALYDDITNSLINLQSNTQLQFDAPVFHTYKYIPDETGCVNGVSISSSNLTVTHETIIGANDGSALLSNITTGVGPYSISYYDSVNNLISTGSSVSNLPPGSYTVTVVDSEGCSSSVGFIINTSTTSPCNIQVTLNESVDCNGIANLIINTNQNTSTWLIEWYDPNGNIISAPTANTTNLQVNVSNLPGVYSVKIEDTSFSAGSCTTTLNFAPLSAGSLMSLAISSTNVSTYNGSDGTATALVSGGAAPYNYSWSNGSSTQVINNLPAGYYTVTVTDSKGCSSFSSVTISEPVPQPVNAKCLKVCLDLNEGVFDFVDENNYSPSGVQLPYRIALTIEHSNGTIVYPGSLSNPDIFSDSDLSNLRTYDYNIKYGQNNTIPIPTSGGNYISDVYKVTTQWSFSGNSIADVTKVCYINAQGLAMFDNLQIDTELTYSCTGDLISKDNTVYGMTGIPFTISRTHKLFAPATANLPNPAFSTGSNMITHDLYEGEWSNFIETFVTWTVPSMPALGITYEPLCVKKTMYGTASADVECFVDPCVVQHYSKKIKNKYDQAVCDCDTLKIKKYRAQLQRIVELLNVYIIGDKSDCVNDYSELWTILGITYQDHLTDPNCCSTPNINPNMIGDGCADGPCGGDGGGGDPPPPPPDPDPCLCDESTPYWTQSNQSAGTYAVGDLVIYSTGGPGSLENPGSCIACFQVGNIPSGGWDSSVPLNETPNNDLSAYWTLVDCPGSSGNPDCYGCTDSTASNYDPAAIYDDGSCTTCIYGCTDSTALNYNANATCNDGSCIAIVYGCTDPTACNYFMGAMIDDGSCCYTRGCMDPNASNYDPDACCPDDCVYGSGCSTTTWTSVHDLIPGAGSIGALFESIPRYSMLDIDTGAGSSGNKNLLILGKSKVSYSKINNSGGTTYAHGDLSNITAPQDYYSYHNNISVIPFANSSNFVKDSNDRYYVLHFNFLQLYQRSSGQASAGPNDNNPFGNDINGNPMTSPSSYVSYVLPALVSGKEMRYTTMDIDGTGTLHILFGSKDDVVDTSAASGSYKTYYYTVDTSTGAFTLVDTLNESSADCHLYWRNESSVDLVQVNAGKGYEKGEWNAVLKVDSSNKPWVASNGKLMKYDSGWKNISGAAATANAGDFHAHPTTGANTVFSVDNAGNTKNPGGANTGHKWTYRDTVLDFVIDGSNKYILTYSTRKLVNAIQDGLITDTSRRGEVILHIHNGSSWSHLPVPSQRDANGTSQLEHFFDNYTSFPQLIFKPTIAIRSGVPYVHLLCNDYDGSDFGKANVSWVWKYESSTWTQVSTDVYSNTNGCGLQDLGSLQLSTTCQPLTGMIYDSAADDLYVIYSEIAQDITGGVPHGRAGIKKICF